MYSNRILAFTLMALILNLAVPAFAQTYYLDAVNGDDSNPGTSNQPWRTLGKAQSVLAEGDKVLLADGDYGDFTTTPDSTYSGDMEDSLQDVHVRWITFEARAGHNPVLGNVVFAWNSGRCYLRYWFKNLKMRRLKLKKMVAFNMDNCEIVGPGANIQYAYGGAVSIRSSSNVTISNCDIHFCSGTSVSISSSAHISIFDSDIYDVGADHITLRTEYSDCYNIRIIGNTIRDSIQWDSSAHPDGIQIYSANGHKFRNFIFARNTMRNMAVQGLFIHASNGGFENGLIENNLIYNCGSREVAISRTSDTIFRNNTVVGYSSFSEKNQNLAVYNNLFCGTYAPKDPAVLGYHDYNIYVQDYKDWLKGTEAHSYMYPKDQKSVMRDGLFLDPDGGDYSLKENCLATNFCPASPAPDEDKLARPRDAVPDAGCYEYMGSTPPVADPPEEEPVIDNPPVDDTPVEEPVVDEQPVDDTPAEEPVVDEQPVDDTPAEEPVVDEQPVDDTPAEEPVVDEQPVDDTPAEEPVVDNPPVDDTPVEEPVVDEQPVDDTPAEEPVIDNLPVDDTPAEEPVVDEQPVDDTPAEEPVIDNPPVDDTPAEEPVVDEQPVDDTSAEEPVVDEQPVDDTPAEEPVVDNPPVDDTPAEEPVIDEQPVDDTPAEEPVVDEQPVDDTPVEEPVVDEQPVDDTPAEEPVIDDQPVDDTPAEEPVADNPPVDDSTAGSSSVGGGGGFSSSMNQSAGSSTAANAPEENSTVKNPPVDNSPVEETPEEDLVVDEQPVDAEPVDNPPADSSEDDSTVDDPPVDDEPADDPPAADQQTNDDNQQQTVSYGRWVLRRIWIFNRWITRQDKRYERQTNYLGRLKQRIQDNERMRQDIKERRITYVDNRMSRVKASYSKAIDKLQKVLAGLMYPASAD